MKKAHFKIRIAGSGVSPDTVGAGDLAELILGIEQTLASTVEAEGIPAEEALVSLVEIYEGSDLLTFAVTPSGHDAAAAVSKAVISSDYSPLPPKAHEGIRNIWKKTVEKKWAVEFVPDSKGKIKHAVISSRSDIPPVGTTQVIRGTTTLFGRCLRVGGAKPRAEVRLFDGTLLFIDVTEPMAKQLARSLYEEVGIEGEAIWDENWKIRDFTARAVTDYRGSDPGEAFGQLREAAKGTWDKVDPEEFVRKLRYGDEA